MTRVEKIVVDAVLRDLRATLTEGEEAKRSEGYPYATGVYRGGIDSAIRHLEDLSKRAIPEDVR